ncbi:unnamed protein product [Auanema sp. JU1783]|nr:unnamed protein product [Auanema sp. JU1783]
MKCVLLLLAVASCSVHANSEEELNKLTTQVRSELSAYFDEAQFKKAFGFLLEHYTSSNEIKAAAVDMYKKVRDDVLTSEQRIQISRSIADAAESLGGVDQLKKLVYHALDKFIDFFNPQLVEDRKQFAELKQNGKSTDDVNSSGYQKLAGYWNKSYGQKVIDVVKCSMSEKDWNIVTKDAASYMFVNNFDMTYHC